ncbi:MAG: DeoR/GlpR transcriptional regulator [Oscillospiraceae bacterium]|nr:DeoR/GlpR transcriptional regulator [Oscillospiraceae bacterium]
MKNSKSNIMVRKRNILSYLETHNFVKYTELAETMKVSVATIRRDITALEKNGKVMVRMGGVALSSNFKNLPNFDSAPMRQANSGIKDAIAREAAVLLEDGDSVFMNSSSSAIKLFPHIQDKALTIITNNGRSVLQSRSPSVELIITGGEVVNDNPNGQIIKAAMTGDFTLSMINMVNATKCVLGVSGISASGGLTSQSIQDASVNKAMVRQCTGAVIIVADHRKIGVRHNFFFTPISSVTHLITDDKSDPKELEKIRNAGVKVIVVKTDSLEEREV